MFKFFSVNPFLIHNSKVNDFYISALILCLIKGSNFTGLLLSSQDPGGTVNYSYNSAGKPDAITTAGSTVTMGYDGYGRQTSLIDPNAGTIAYTYNIFGELATQQEPPVNGMSQNRLTTMTYDKLGRVKTKVVDGITTDYTYDQGTKAKGTLTSVSGNGVTMSYTYSTEGLCHVFSETRSKGTESFGYGYTYDSKGRVSTLTYPTGFAVNYTYSNYDDLTEVKTGTTSIWKISPGDVNAKGQLENALYGNGKKITYGYDAQDRLNHISVPNLIDFSYEYNDKQQLNYRYEKYFDTSWKGFKEEFTYDDVNRLKTAAITAFEGSAPPPPFPSLSMDYAHEANDRITQKSDVGTYTYQPNNHRIDQLAAVAGYNPPKHDITYTTGGKIATLTETNNSVANKILNWEYDSENERFKSEYTEDGTRKYTRYYFNTYEKEVLEDNTIRHLNYVYASGSLVAIYEQKATVSKMYYVYSDYLGSLRCVTDDQGTVERRLSYDAWGNRRNYETGIKLAPGTGGFLFARGYTGHEHLDEFALINMNGRVYDPMLGMFLSPDDYVQAPTNSQNFNRYTYCFNNPLMYTDPTGNWAGWDDVIVGGIGFALGYVSYGLRNGDWGWNAIGAGAISAGTFLMGYYSGGATSASNIANAFAAAPGAGQAYANTVALGFAGRMVASSVVSSFMPSMSIPIGDNFTMSVSPGIGFGPGGLVGGVNVSGTYHDGNNAYSLGFGSNTNSASISGGYSDGHFSLSYYRTTYGNDIGPDGNSNSQTVGGISYSVGKFSARIENDFMGDRYDRWRSNAVELGFWGGDFVIGTTLYNNYRKKGDAVDKTGDNFHKTLFGNKTYGRWIDGQTYSSPLYAGLRSGNNITRLGYSHRSFQNAAQNIGAHKAGFLGSHLFGYANYFKDYDNFQYGPYSYSGYYNPYSLW